MTQEPPAATQLLGTVPLWEVPPEAWVGAMVIVLEETVLVLEGRMPVSDGSMPPPVGSTSPPSNETRVRGMPEPAEVRDAAFAAPAKSRTSASRQIRLLFMRLVSIDKRSYKYAFSA